ncbi:hypothetical protein A0256_20985 [Mucilaginibacter sp. PAMC 26640]|nr:hypothetical protein A0256_20985 [Mucilaginibacter sp. PAMC 26640]
MYKPHTGRHRVSLRESESGESALCLIINVLAFLLKRPFLNTLQHILLIINDLILSTWGTKIP